MSYGAYVVKQLHSSIPSVHTHECVCCPAKISLSRILCDACRAIVHGKDVNHG